MRASIFEKDHRLLLSRDGPAAWTWLRSIGIAAAVGAAYFLAAQLANSFLITPETVIFWPATLKEPTTTWLHWIVSDFAGIVSVAPFGDWARRRVAARPAAARIHRSIVALAAVGAMTGVIVSLPEELWETVVPFLALNYLPGPDWFWFLVGFVGLFWMCFLIHEKFGSSRI